MIFETTILDEFQFQSQIILSQINVIVPIRFRFKIYALFIQWGSRIDLLFVGPQDIVNYRRSPRKVSGNEHKRLVPKITRHDRWETFVETSFPERLVFLKNLWEWLRLHSFFGYHYLILLSESVFPHSLQLSWFFSTTINICNFRDSRFQKVGAHAVRSRHDIFAQEWTWSFSNILSKCTETAPTLSNKTSIVWNLYLSWNNDHVTTFRWQMNVGGFSKLQYIFSDINKDDGCFLPLVSLKSMWILWKELLSSVLFYRLINVWLFLYCPVVKMHPALSFEIRIKQGSNGSFVPLNVLYSMESVYSMRGCMGTMSWAKSGLLIILLLNNNPKSLPTLFPIMCPSAVLNNSKPGSSF